MKCAGRVLAITLLAMLCSAGQGLASPTPPPDSTAEEITVQLTVDGLGAIVLPAYYLDGDVYLPLLRILKFLEIKAIPSKDGRVINGFFIEEDQPYTFDAAALSLRVADVERSLLVSDIVSTESEIFLRHSIIADAFGVECSFNFRTLNVRLASQNEFPAIRARRRSDGYQKLKRPRDMIESADRFVGRDRGLFHLGTLDWGLTSSRSYESHLETYAFRGGAELLGGDLSLGVHGTVGNALDWSALMWQWRFVYNASPYFTQAIVGRDIAPAIATGGGAIDGAVITNRPVMRRSAFGTYIVAGRTEPGWTVDLYVNHELVTFVLADQTGAYEIPVPLSYGSTNVSLKFYGPWGEERERDEVIRIPFIFLPPGEIEYSVSAGFLRSDSSRAISTGVVHVGLLPELTVGGGLQYSRVSGHDVALPFASASYRIDDAILASLEYVGGYSTSASLSYVGATGVAMNASYQRIVPNGWLGGTSHRDKGRLGVASVVRAGSLVGALTLAGTVEANGSETNLLGLECGLATQIAGIQASYDLRGVMPSSSDLGWYGRFVSTLLLSRGLPLGINWQSRFQFDHMLDRPTLITTRFERSLFGLGFLSISASHQIISRLTTLQLDFRYNLPFASGRLALRSIGRSVSLNQDLHGTFAYDETTGTMVPGYAGTVGRGGLTLRPFLDENNNGKIDSAEAGVENLDVRINGGRVVMGDKGLIRVVDLVPYQTYRIELGADHLEYLAWQPSLKTMDVIVDPNRFKEIPIPVVVAGEVLGTVQRSSNGQVISQGGVRVLFRALNGRRTDTATTFSNGEFAFMGLPPGRYRATLDPAQLSMLNVASSPAFVDFTLRGVRQGDIVENVAFSIVPHGMGGGLDTGIADYDPFDPTYRSAFHVTIPGIQFAAQTTKALDSLAEMVASRDITVVVRTVVAVSYTDLDLEWGLGYASRIRSYLIDVGVDPSHIELLPWRTDADADVNGNVVEVMMQRSP